MGKYASKMGLQVVFEETECIFNIRAGGETRDATRTFAKGWWDGKFLDSTYFW